MGEMTDCEINKRLAEIAELRWGEARHGSARVGNEECGYMWAEEWSPLTDWSQLGPMMERFRVGIEYQGAWDAWAYNADDLGNEGQHCDPDLKRAICLAIIASHQPDAGEEEPHHD